MDDRAWAIVIERLVWSLVIDHVITWLPPVH
jgi:hypothetical protein